MTRCAIYCRISRDPERSDEGLRGVGVERQEKDCRALANGYGYDIVEVYTDNDMGASTVSRTKVRPAFERMVRDAKAGKFERILAYSNSRLTRRLSELAIFVDLFDHYNAVTVQTVVSGDFNLATADGRLVANIVASVDQAEAEKTSERLKASHFHRAKKGQVWKGGNRAFGWSEDYKTLDRVESKHLLKAVKDVLRGTAITAVARDWNEKGVKTPAGKDWNFPSVRAVMVNPRLCGWTTYHKQVVKDDKGNPVLGEWDPLITVEQREALLAAVAKRHKPKRRSGKYLLSPFLRCGRCSGAMTGVIVRGEARYRCYNQHLSVAAGAAEGFVRFMAFVHLSECAGAIDVDEDPGVWEDEERLLEVIAKISGLMGAFNTGRLSMESMLPEVEKLEAEQRTLERERDDFYRNSLVAKAPKLVEDMLVNVNWLDGEYGWFEIWGDSIHDEYDWNEWQAILTQHCRVIFIRPYDGPDQGKDDRISILWDDGTKDGQPGGPVDEARKERRARKAREAAAKGGGRRKTPATRATTRVATTGSDGS